jgi:hypothetical protein
MYLSYIALDPLKPAELTPVSAIFCLGIYDRTLRKQWAVALYKVPPTTTAYARQLSCSQADALPGRRAMAGHVPRLYPVPPNMHRNANRLLC